MKTYLDCIPCFFKQALEAARIAGAGRKKQKEILDRLSKALPEFPLTSSPPEMGKTIYGLARAVTGNKDPYKAAKEKSNAMALGIYGRLKERVERSSDRLLTAVELAIAGNIMDYGVKNTLDVDKELERILAEEDRAIEKESRALFDYRSFRKTLEKSSTVLYLADNAGETVFDRVLIEEIKRADKDKEVIYAVKEKPVINDALAEDAVFCGIDKNARIMSSGSDGPGTILSLCSKDFLELFRGADMVISKGQGNFEALSSAGRDIYFLFMAKCPVIAKDAGCAIGDVILRHYPGKRKRQKRDIDAEVIPDHGI